MTELGKVNTLEVLRTVDFGCYLQSDLGDILLPQKYMLPDTNVGDMVDVFIYKDSEDRLIATNLTPNGMVGDFVVMVCKENAEIGAFMEWGLEKDLMVPHAEQHRRMKSGEKYVVRICIDPRTERIFGTSRIAAFLHTDQQEQLIPGQEVNLLIYEITDLGYMALIDEKYRGIIYKNEIFKKLEVGDKVQGFIKKVREDNKIDLTLDKFGYSKVRDAKTIVWEILMEKGGEMPFSDKSSPEEIKEHFQMSKGVFKEALGALFKERKIKIVRDKVTVL